MARHIALGLIAALGLFLTSGVWAVTYEVALRNAKANADIHECDAINKPLVQQDYVISAGQAREMCRIEVVAAQGKPEACLTLDNKRQFPADVTAQHRCLESMARSLRRADICQLIGPEQESSEDTWYRARCKVEAVFSKRDCRAYEDHSEQQSQLLRDECRVNSINDLHQCTQGFYVLEIRKRLSDPDACIFTVTANTRNTALCAMSTSLEKRRVCEANVRRWQEVDKQQAHKPLATPGP